MNAIRPLTKPTFRRKVRRWFLIITCTYVSVCLAVGVFQSKLIFFPSQEVWGTPLGIGLGYEEVTLTTQDGITLSAWYVPAASSKGTVLYFHGNAGNISDSLHGVQLFNGLGYNGLIFDYRGYGRSEGSPGEQGLRLDAQAAWDYLIKVQGESPRRIVMFGRSLGGGVAIHLASRHAPAALIVESTFTSLGDVARQHYPFLPIKLLLIHRFDSINIVPMLSCPKLFVHGSGDELIPIAIGRALFEASAEPKAFIETPGGHYDTGLISDPEYTSQLDAFLTSALSHSSSS